MNDPKYKNTQPSHLRRVKCRVCKVELKFKNYGNHLANVHPAEDNKNLSSLSDQSISRFYFTSKRARVSTDEGVNLEENSDLVMEESIADDPMEDIDDGDNFEDDNLTNQPEAPIHNVLTNINEPHHNSRPEDKTNLSVEERMFRVETKVDKILSILSKIEENQRKGNTTVSTTENSSKQENQSTF